MHVKTMTHDPVVLVNNIQIATLNHANRETQKHGFDILENIHKLMKKKVFLKLLFFVCFFLGDIKLTAINVPNQIALVKITSNFPTIGTSKNNGVKFCDIIP